MAEARKYSRARPQRDHKYSTTLGIDWGSEGVRAMVSHKMEDGQIVEKLILLTTIPEKMRSIRQGAVHEFTSQIYPFDSSSPNPPGETIYPGKKPQPGRRSISSKLAMYAVVGISDEVAKQSLELGDLELVMQSYPQLKQIIRIGIEEMISCVLRQVHALLNSDSENFRHDIDAIALTIPAQWTIEFEEEYGERFTTAWERVFNYATPQLIFMTEGQTNAHYALFRGKFSPEGERPRRYLPAQGLLNIEGTKNAVLLIDAGGHSTNTSLISICHDNNQLEIRPDHGVIGGTSEWEWHILAEMKLKWLYMFDKTMPVEVENEILKTFYAHCPGYTDQTRAIFVLKDPDTADSGIYVFSFDPEELVRSYEFASRHAFALIEQGILQLKKLQPSCDRVEILVRGGSAQSPMWIQRMNNLCRKHQMAQPTYPIHEYYRLAAGANYALATANSVAQFVEKAAFGLAVKKRFKGENGWTNDWHYQATLLWARGNKWIKTIKADVSEEFKIICQPEYDNPRAKSIIEPDYKAYDILPIPCQKRGTLQFDFEIDTNSDKLKLAIKHRVMLESGKTGRSNELGRVEFDLWVAPGSRCLQIWDCVEDIEAKVAAAFSGHQHPAGNNASSGGQVEEMEVDSGPPRQPSAAPGLQAQRGSPELGSEDVEMGGMEDDEEIADSITVAPVPGEVPQSPRQEGGSQAAERRRRRGSTVPTGIFAL